MSRQRRLRLLAAGIPIAMPEGLSVGEEQWIEQRVAHHQAEQIQALRAR